MIPLSSSTNLKNTPEGVFLALVDAGELQPVNSDVSVGEYASGVYLLLLLIIVVLRKKISEFLPFKISKVLFIYVLVNSLLSGTLQNSARLPEKVMMNAQGTNVSEYTHSLQTAAMVTVSVGRALEVSSTYAMFYILYEIKSYNENIILQEKMKNGHKAHILIMCSTVAFAIGFYAIRAFPVAAAIVAVFAAVATLLYSFEGHNNVKGDRAAHKERIYCRRYAYYFKIYMMCKVFWLVVATTILATIKIELIITFPLTQLILLYHSFMESCTNNMRVAQAPQPRIHDDPISERTHRIIDSPSTH